MEINNTINRILERVRIIGIGASFTYDEVSHWLDIPSGVDLIRVYDELSDRLMKEHSLGLELKEDCVIAVSPDDSDIDAAERRNLFSTTLNRHH